TRSIQRQKEPLLLDLKNGYITNLKIKKMDKTLLQQLAKRLNLIDEDAAPDPYILTPEEETKVIEHAIEREKANYHWRMLQKGLKEGDIELRMSQEDWMSRINREEILSKANSNKN